MQTATGAEEEAPPCRNPDDFPETGTEVGTASFGSRVLPFLWTRPVVNGMILRQRLILNIPRSIFQADTRFRGSDAGE